MDNNFFNFLVEKNYTFISGLWFHKGEQLSIDDLMSSYRKFYKQKKKILYIDMDGVTANFMKFIYNLYPEIDFYDEDKRSKIIDEIMEKTHTRLFKELEPMDGAVNSIKELMNYFDIYFLSTPHWNNTYSFMDKRIWVHDHFGEDIEKRLILTHRKDLAFGDFLIDDRTKNGAGEFRGELILFGEDKPYFKNWDIVKKYLLERV